MEYRIATYAMSDNDAKFLGILLDLANRHLPVPWQTCPQDQAGIFIVDVDKPEGHEFWLEQQRQGRSLVALSWQVQPYSETWTLSKPLTSSLYSLIDLLQAISAALPASVITRPVPAQEGNELSYFDPSCYPLGKTREILRHGTIAVLNPDVGQSLPSIYVLPAQQRWYLSAPPSGKLVWTSKDMLALWRSCKVRCTPLSLAELKSTVAERNISPQPLAKLLWISALHASQGRLPRDVTPHTPVHLKYWPNFTHLNYLPEHMTLAAFMLKNSVSLQSITERTQVPLSVVTDFYNACAALDLIQRLEPEQASQLPAPVAPPRVGLFNKIMQRLRPAQLGR